MMFKGAKPGADWFIMYYIQIVFGIIQLYVILILSLYQKINLHYRQKIIYSIQVFPTLWTDIFQKNQSLRVLMIFH